MPKFGLHQFARAASQLFEQSPDVAKSVAAAGQMQEAVAAARGLKAGWDFVHGKHTPLAPRGLPAVRSSAYSARNPNIGMTQPASGLHEPHHTTVPATAPPMQPALPLPGLPLDFPVAAPDASPDLGASANYEAGRLSVEAVGMPSLRMYLNDNNNTVASLRRMTNYMEYIEASDLSAMRAIAQGAYFMMKNMSQGPYTLKVLRAMGHPYGFDKVVEDGTIRKVPRRVRRYVPGVGSIGHAKGVRGSVPNMTVINKQSGNLDRSWRWGFTMDKNGITLNWWNEAKSKDGFPYPFALMGGTVKMQAHGPWTYVLARALPDIDREWRAITLRAFRRAQAHEIISNSIVGGEENNT